MLGEITFNRSDGSRVTRLARALNPDVVRNLAAESVSVQVDLHNVSDIHLLADLLVKVVTRTMGGHAERIRH